MRLTPEKRVANIRVLLELERITTNHFDEKLQAPTSCLLKCLVAPRSEKFYRFKQARLACVVPSNEQVHSLQPRDTEVLKAPIAADFEVPKHALLLSSDVSHRQHGSVKVGTIARQRAGPWSMG
jgi:hypothetical protein